MKTGSLLLARQRWALPELTVGQYGHRLIA